MKHACYNSRKHRKVERGRLYHTDYHCQTESGRYFLPLVELSQPHRDLNVHWSGLYFWLADDGTLHDPNSARPDTMWMAYREWHRVDYKETT